MGADEEEGNKEEEKQLHCISEDADQCGIGTLQFVSRFHHTDNEIKEWLINKKNNKTWLELLPNHTFFTTGLILFYKC